jgi:RTX calcium-binding nonapeptide repeat (4 copies)
MRALVGLLVLLLSGPLLAQVMPEPCHIGTASGEVIKDTIGFNCMTGNAGNDTLQGLSGRDRIDGALVSARYSSSSGADQMYGGTELDIFYPGPHKLVSQPSGVDHIRDFQAGETICSPVAMSGWRRRAVGSAAQIIVTASTGERVIAVVENMGSKSATVRRCSII